MNGSDAESTQPWLGPGYQQPVVALPNGSGVAPFGRRVVARLIDVGVLVALVVGLNWALGDWFGVTTRTVTQNGTTTFYTMTPYGMLVTCALAFLLEVVLPAFMGGQVGKLLMGLRIADAETLRVPLGWTQLLGRWVLLGGATALCVLPGVLVGLSPVFNRPWLRGWHDRACGSIVVIPQVKSMGSGGMRPTS